MLSAGLFVAVAASSARTSECRQPRPAVIGKATPARAAHPSNMRKAAPSPRDRSLREARLGASARGSGCVSLACPGAIMLGVGF